VSWDEDFKAECWCGRGEYDPRKYSSCYDCFKERIADLASCIFCGKKHSAEYATCFDCRQITNREEAAKALKFDILIRDKFICNDCGCNESLQVDHIKPCFAQGSANPWNLQVLCRDCNMHKGSNWYYGCRWDAKRIELMHLYFTFGWSLLTEDQQKELCEDALDYTDFDWHSRMKKYVGEEISPPQWAIDYADNESVVDV